MKARGSCFRSACTKGWAFRKLRSSLLSFRKSLLLARVGSLRSFSAIHGWLERNWSKERNSSRVFSVSYCHRHGAPAAPLATSPRVTKNENNARRARCGMHLTVFYLLVYCTPFPFRIVANLLPQTQRVFLAKQPLLNQHARDCPSTVGRRAPFARLVHLTRFGASFSGWSADLTS